MGKLFCLSVFGRKMKANKPPLDKEAFQLPKDMGDPCGIVDPPLIAESPESCSTCSEIEGSKDASSEPRHCISSEMQTATAPNSQLDLNPRRIKSTELVTRAETIESHDELYSRSLLGPRLCTTKGTPLGANDAVTRNGVETKGFCIAISPTDAQGECADMSEMSFEGLESVSNPPSCEYFIRPPGESTSLDAHLEYFGSENQFAPLSQPYGMDGAQHPNNIITAGYEAEGLTPCLGFLYSPDTTIFPCNKSDRTLPDDEILTGHTSDPGVYDRDEQHSMSGSSVLLSSSIIVPLHTVEPNFLRKSESDSHICKLVPSEGNVENTYGETGEHGKEMTFCSDKVILKPVSSYKFRDSNEHCSPWKTFMVSHRNIHVEGSKESLDAVAFGRGSDDKPPSPKTGHASDICGIGHSSECDRMAQNALITTGRVEKATSPEILSDNGQEERGSVLAMGLQASYGTSLWPSEEWITHPTAESGWSRVEEWIRNIEQSDAPPEEELPPENKEPSSEICIEETVGVASAIHKTVGAVTVDVERANAAIRSLNPFSTVAHIAGIGLREVPSLGKFNSLKTLNLSANHIVRVPAGCLPRSLHTLDLSRNRLGVIEGFRELARLRVLNFSYNRISRIGHGLANCTLIKELYLTGNKIGEVEGLHRLLKLSILDLSFNKLTTSKSLGQLAANYSSLLALNLLGNPVCMNIGEEQLRKFVLSITPHVTYLNKQPIKAVPAREAVVDSVARAAMGTPQRNSKSSSTRSSRKTAEARSTHQHNKSYGRHGKDVEIRHGSLFSESESKHSRLTTQHHHHHQHNDGRLTEKVVSKEHRHSSRAPLSVHEHLLQKLAKDIDIQGMHRSRSESALQGQID